MLKKIVFIIGFFVCCVAYSQAYKEEVLFQINEFENNIHSNPQKSLQVITTAKKIASQHKDSFLLARCYHKIGYYYYLKNDYNKSIENINTSLLYCNKSNAPVIIAANYVLLGNIKTDKNNYKEAAQLYFYSLKIAERNNLELNKCIAKLNLGLLYDKQLDTLKALKYNNEALELATKNSFYAQLFDIKNNIALLIKKNEPKKAIAFYKENYEYAKLSNYSEGVFSTIINLTSLYIDFENKEWVQQIPSLLTEVETIFNDPKDVYHQFHIHFNWGGYYLMQNNFKKAEEHYLKAQHYLQPPILLEDENRLYYALSINFHKAGNFEKAYQFQNKYQQINSKIINSKRIKDINELQTQYDVEKKDLKIELLSKDIALKKKQKQFYLTLGIAVVAFLLLVLWFLRKKIKTQKIIQLQKEQLYNQEKESLKKEQELQLIKSKLSGEETERNRIAQELHDGVSGKIVIVKHHLADLNTNLKDKKLKESIQTISDIYKDIRIISHNLSTNFTINKSFITLIHKLLNEFSQSSKIEVELSIYPEEQLEKINETIKRHLYRIMQELLNNISKHAKAKQVFLNLTQFNNNITLIIEDDGIGIDENAKKGIGLNNIYERVKSMQGEIQIESTNSKGTSIIIDIQIEDSNENH